jgi:hypothetical protein
MSTAVERATVGMLMAIKAAVASSSIPQERHVTTAQYLLVTCCNVPGALAGRAHGCTKQAISKALRAVEDRRDDPQYNAELTRLERIFEGG